MLNVAQCSAFVCICMLLIIKFVHMLVLPTFCVFVHSTSTIDVRITEFRKSWNVHSSLDVSVHAYLLMDVQLLKPHKWELKTQII